MGVRAISLVLLTAVLTATRLQAGPARDAYVETPRQTIADQVQPYAGPLVFAYWNIQDLSHEPDRRYSAEEVRNHLDAVTTQLNKYNPPILCLSEVNRHETTLHLNSLLDHPYPFAATTDYFYRNRPEREGRNCLLESAVLSRIPWSSIEELDFPLVNKELDHGMGRGFLKITFQTPPGPVTVYTGHLKSNFGGSIEENMAKRKQAVQLVIEDIRASDLSTEWHAIILAGDLNTDIYQEAFAAEQTLPLLLREGFVNLLDQLPPSRRITLPPIRMRGTEYGAATFDYILTSRYLGKKPIRIIEEASDSIGEENVGLPGYASDHYMVMMDLGIRL